MGFVAALFYGLTLGVVVFAWKLGSVAERIGAGLNLAAAILVWLIHQVVTAPEATADLLLATDGLLALGFLGLAVTHGRLWLGMALLLQATQFGLHAAYLVGHRPADLTFARVNNLDSWGVLACLFAGTALAWRARRVGGPAA